MFCYWNLGCYETIISLLDKLGKFQFLKLS